MKRLYTVLVLFLVYSFSIFSYAKENISESESNSGSVYNLSDRYAITIKYTSDKELKSICAYVYNFGEIISDVSSLGEKTKRDIVKEIDNYELVNITEFTDSNEVEIQLKEGTYVVVLKGNKSDILSYKDSYKFIKVSEDENIEISLNIDVFGTINNFLARYYYIVFFVIVIGVIIIVNVELRRA